jgi:hypothetical protein
MSWFPIFQLASRVFQFAFGIFQVSQLTRSFLTRKFQAFNWPGGNFSWPAMKLLDFSWPAYFQVFSWPSGSFSWLLGFFKVFQSAFGIFQVFSWISACFRISKNRCGGTWGVRILSLNFGVFGVFRAVGVQARNSLAKTTSQWCTEGGYATINIEISRSKSGQNDLFRPKIIQSWKIYAKQSVSMPFHYILVVLKPFLETKKSQISHFFLKKIFWIGSPLCKFSILGF